MNAISKFINNKNVVPYLFISFPILLIYSLIGYPVINAFRISMYEWNTLSGKKGFVGLNNYIELFSNRTFLEALKNTMFFTVSYVVAGLILGMLLALVVYHVPSRFQNAVKSLYFLPVVVSMVPVAIAFKWLMRSTPDGSFNYYLSFLGVAPVEWLTNAKTALLCVIGVTLWKNCGFIMIVYLAGLLGIPLSYYEAAKIDGAGTWATFWKITLPLLRHTTVFLMVTSFIGAFQVYAQVAVLTNGYGPQGSTNTLGWEIYQKAFTQHNLGSASAMGFIMLFFILIATVVQLKYFGGEKKEG